MKILLVINSDRIAEKLDALNSELEYCGIIVDNVEPAKEILANVGLSTVPLYLMSELKSCTEELTYDYIVSVQGHNATSHIMKELQKYGVPRDKAINFGELHTTGNFTLERELRYLKEHPQEFEILVTGISETHSAVDFKYFKRKLINLAKPSQDLYYDFEIAKHAVLCGQDLSSFRYALIGLAPYSFHYDLSQVFTYKALFLRYFIALNDLHNFSMPSEVYRKFISAKYLCKKISLDSFKLHRPFWNKIMDQKDIEAVSSTWKGRRYPKTREENIKILDNYLTFCEKNGIRPIMFRAPVSEKFMRNFDSELLEEFDYLVKQACLKHPSACFVDGWKFRALTYADFCDHEHLNIYGAAKFSSYLNDYIEELELNSYKNLDNFYNSLYDFTDELDRLLYNRFEAKGR